MQEKLNNRPKVLSITQDTLIKCDHCDYTIPNYSKTDDPDTLIKGVGEYLDIPCPECKENLLTKKDFRIYKFYMKSVKFINKWFWWLAKHPEVEKTFTVDINPKNKKSDK